MSIKKFTIDRNSWSRGIPKDTCLLNANGMCCLGFAALACGYSEDQIKGEERPEELVNNLLRRNKGKEGFNLWFDGLIERSGSDCYPFNSTKICEDIIECNDSYDLSDEEREEELKNLFGKLGVEVDFVS